MSLISFRDTDAIIAYGNDTFTFIDLGGKADKKFSPEYLIALLTKLTMQFFSKF